MNKSVKVSVIIPMYKCESCVDKMLDSLCNQQLHEIEIICVVDGAFDNTFSKADRFAQKDPRVLVLIQEHGGAGKARNTGLVHASGKYVISIDADDEFSDSFIIEMYNAAEENDADIVMCDFYLQNTCQNIVSARHANGFDKNRIPVNAVTDPASIEGLYQAIRGVSWNKLIRRQIIVENGLRFSELTAYNELFLTYTAVHCSKRLLAIDKALYTYTVGFNDHSITSEKKLQPEKYIDAFISAYSDLYDWLESHDKANHYRETYCLKWKSEFHELEQCGINMEIAEKTAYVYAMVKPWCDMDDGELIEKSGLQTYGLQIDNLLSKRRTGGTEGEAQEKIIKLRNSIGTRIMIRKILREKYHKKISEQDPFLIEGIKKVIQYGIPGCVKKIINSIQI